MEIESFFPGRIRISSALFRTRENLARAKSIVGSRPGVRSVSANPRTGSLTILYDAGVVTMDMLVEAKREIESWENRE